jgi:diacylglycerol kinase family enzyme
MAPGSPHARAAAAAALLLLAGSGVLALVVAVESFPDGLTVLVCLLAAVAAGWWGLVRGGVARTLGLGVALIAVAGAVVLVLVQGNFVENTIVLVGFIAALAAASLAFSARAELPAAPRPRRPVLFYNPKSGGGKAERFRVADEARERGVEAIELKLGDDLEELVRDAVARGADAVGMAGGDGSQAIVASVAAEHGLPHVCVPAGTRNHFALDLGVDRDDVVGALDAYVDGRERVVDLAEVNGRVFVNNVSLGVYAEAVQKPGYRAAKLRTIAETLPAMVGPQGRHLDLEWTDGDGHPHSSADVILVSNDAYRLGRALGSGTRPSLDQGVLGIAAVCPNNGRERARLVQWTAPSFSVSSGGPIAAGVDGEALTLGSPVRFVSRARALRVRIAPDHPGASPSARLPSGAWGALRELVRLAARGERYTGADPVSA